MTTEPIRPRMPIPTISQLEEAHRTFCQHEPRDLFYRAARDLIERARHGDSTLSLPEALAVLLLTWNRAFYRFRKLAEPHLTELERLLTCHIIVRLLKPSKPDLSLASKKKMRRL